MFSKMIEEFIPPDSQNTLLSNVFCLAFWMHLIRKKDGRNFQRSCQKVCLCVFRKSNLSLQHIYHMKRNILLLSSSYQKSEELDKKYYFHSPITKNTSGCQLYQSKIKFEPSLESEKSKADT